MNRLLPIITFAALACTFATLGPATATPEPTRIPTIEPMPTRTPRTTPQIIIDPTAPSSTGGEPATDNNGCPVPPGWEPYEVQPGDLLSRIARDYDTTVEEVAAGNCIENPDDIRSGQTLYVPRGDGTGGELGAGIAPLTCTPGIVGDEAIAGWESGDCIGFTPFVSYETGFLALEPGATVTIRYIGDTSGADLVRFSYTDFDESTVTIGEDTTPDDGASVRWAVPSVERGRSGGGRIGALALSNGEIVARAGSIPTAWGQP